MSNRTLNLDDHLHGYLLDHSLREDDIQRRLRAVTAEHEHGRMQISPEQGQFMALLVELMGARRIIEVGTFTGYSALCLARALPADGELVCCDISEEYTAIGRPFWEEAGVAERIDLRIGPAAHSLRSLIVDNGAQQWDMMFVDADKTGYDSYYELGLELLRPGGLMLFDNTLWGGQVADPAIDEPDTASLRALNDKLHTDKRISLSLLPVGDGLTLARKR